MSRLPSTTIEMSTLKIYRIYEWRMLIVFIEKMRIFSYNIILENKLRFPSN